MPNNQSTSDLPQVVLFDIDGTLLDSYAFDTRLFLDAVEAETGRRISGDWNSYTHATDTGLLMEAIPGLDAQTERSIKNRFADATKAHLVTQPGGAEGGHLALPGVRAFIERLAENPGLHLGIATGGWAETAEAKVRHVGLGALLDAGRLAMATASDHYDRAVIMRLAADRALQGKAIPPSAWVYFGDGEWDRRTCAAMGVRFIGIGERVQHQPRFADFSEPDGLLRATGLRSRQ
jgi:FMN phosphatase YigB (HAD superfamily)